MLTGNLKNARKNKGLSQEELAIRLNVVRQTVSKWEKGLSVPDAEMLVRISEVLDVSVKELLGSNIEIEQNDNLQIIAMELQKLNELLALQQEQRKNLCSKVGKVIVYILLIVAFAAIYDQWGDMFFEFGKNLYRAFH